MTNILNAPVMPMPTPPPDPLGNRAIPWAAAWERRERERMERQSAAAPAVTSEPTPALPVGAVPPTAPPRSAPSRARELELLELNGPGGSVGGLTEDIEDALPARASSDGAAAVGAVVVEGMVVPPPAPGLLERVVNVFTHGPKARQIHAARVGAQRQQDQDAEFARLVAAEAARPPVSQAPGDMLSALNLHSQQQRAAELARNSLPTANDAQAARARAIADLEELGRQAANASTSIREAESGLQRAGVSLQSSREQLDAAKRERAAAVEELRADAARAAEQGAPLPASRVDLAALDARLASLAVALETLPNIIGEHQAELQRRRATLAAIEETRRLVDARLARATFLCEVHPLLDALRGSVGLLEAAESAAMDPDERRVTKRLRGQMARALSGLLPRDWRELREIL